MCPGSPFSVSKPSTKDQQPLVRFLVVMCLAPVPDKQPKQSESFSEGPFQYVMRGDDNSSVKAITCGALLRPV